MSTSHEQYVDFALYRYVPSIPAAVTFVLVFAVLSILHSIRLVRYRTFFFIPFVIGLIFEFAGYLARIFSHHDPEALGPYIVQTMLILVAPPLFAASIYMTLGRLMVRLERQEASLIRVKYLTKIFVAGDVLSFLLQCGGGGYMAAGTLSAMETGEAIVLAGLAVQLLFFGCFVAVSAVFHYRVTKDPKYFIDHNHPPSRGRITWESVLWALYAACALILIRSIFRVVEFAQGNDGWIMQREYLLYVFDACLMAMAGIVVWIAFPGAVLYSQRKSRQ